MVHCIRMIERLFSYDFEIEKATFSYNWSISMNRSICNNNNKKLFISKLIVLIADYIAIVLGTLAAYY